MLPRLDWRRAAVVAAFPVGLLWVLASQRVHFTRNALAIHPFVAMFASIGFVALHGWIVKVADRRGWALHAGESAGIRSGRRGPSDHRGAVLACR